MENNLWKSKVDLAFLNWATYARVPLSLNRDLIQSINIEQDFHTKPVQTNLLLRKMVEDGRQLVATMLGLESAENLILTTGTLHSLEICLGAERTEGGFECITTSREFDASYHILSKFFLQVKLLDYAALNNAISKIPASRKKKLFFISHVEHIFGEGVNLKALISNIRIKFPSAVIIIDGSQAVGNINVDLTDFEGDYYLFSTNKWLLCSNNGFIYARSKKIFLRILPSIYSPYSVSEDFAKDKKSTSGINLSSASSLRNTLQYLLRYKAFMGKSNIHLKELFWEGLSSEIKNRFNPGAKNNQASGILNLNANHVSDRSLIKFHQKALVKGLYFNLFLPYQSESFNKYHTKGIRFAFHVVNSENEIFKAVEYLNKNMLRHLSD